MPLGRNGGRQETCRAEELRGSTEGGACRDGAASRVVKEAGLLTRQPACVQHSSDSVLEQKGTKESICATNASPSYLRNDGVVVVEIILLLFMLLKCFCCCRSVEMSKCCSCIFVEFSLLIWFLFLLICCCSSFVS